MGSTPSPARLAMLKDFSWLAANNNEIPGCFKYIALRISRHVRNTPVVIEGSLDHNEL